MNNFLVLRALLLLLFVAMVTSEMQKGPFGTALAQDGDDDDDDDDDDGGTGGGNGAAGAGDDGDHRPGATSRQPRPVAPAPAQVDLPLFAPGELVTLRLSEADRDTLLALGYTVLDERPVPQLGTISRRLSVPDGKSLEDARAEVRTLATGTDADFNHYYRSEEAPDPVVCQGPHCASFDLIGWQVSAFASCSTNIAVGIIDTGINPDHPTFASSRLEVHKLSPGELDPSRAIHGTAVTALLIGDPASRSPGLLPGARVVAVDAFHKDGGDERADVYTLVAAMDFLAEKDIRVINMSFAGPPNTVLERAVETLASRDVVLVAAIGNAGPRAEPAYPAAYPEVVAVTAVDRNGEIYRRAGRGMHVDLAAPGVDIWTAASIKGARPKTGTSFAAPIVSATAAVYLSADPQLSARDLFRLLTASAKDLGTEEFDEIYDYGLVQAAPDCRLDGLLSDR